MCDDMGIDTGIDLDALIGCAELARDIVGRELPSALLHAGPRYAAVRVMTTNGPDEYERLAEHAARAQQGNLAKEADKLASQHKLFVRDRLARLLDDGSFVEDALLANALAGDLPADGVVTGVGPRRRPAGVRDGERPDGEGRLVGRADRREDRSPHRARAAARAAGRVPRRLRRRAHHRPGRAVSRAARRGPDLRQRGAALGQGPAGVLPLRTFGRGRRLHPGVLRRRVHGRRERLDVSRLAPDGRGRDRRARLTRGDGRRPHARDRERVRRQPVRVGRRGDRRCQTLPLVSADVVASRPARRRRSRAGRRRSPDPPTRSHRGTARRTTCTRSSTRWSTTARSSS